MNNGERSAFPSHGTMGEVVETGLTKREWFAGMALAGLCANAEVWKVLKFVSAEEKMGQNEMIAKVSSDLADAMIREREKT